MAYEDLFGPGQNENKAKQTHCLSDLLGRGLLLCFRTVKTAFFSFMQVSSSLGGIICR
jgi:hypothetical protein